LKNPLIFKVQELQYVHAKIVFYEQHVWERICPSDNHISTG